MPNRLNRFFCALLILSSLILSMACSAPIASRQSTIESRIESATVDADFLFALESTLLNNGFAIHERAIDSTGYRFNVTWIIPSARQQFWQRLYKLRYNGTVIAERVGDSWQVGAEFGTFDDQTTVSLEQEFDLYVVAPLDSILAKGKL
jgi:hypothetical protein